MWLVLVALATPKNVLYIVSDDLRPELGSCGLPRHTPHLDRLAQTGASFDRAYAQQALCGPSRNSFMSGRRPDQTKSWNMKNHFRQVPGAQSWTSLPGVFKDSGYLTLGTGKLYHPCVLNGSLANVSHAIGDCGGPPEYDGKKSWSEEALPFANPCWHYGIECYPCPKRPSPIDPGWDTTGLQWCMLEALDDKYTAEHALRLLKTAKAKKKPFFLGVGFHKPHLPWQAAKEWFDKYPLDNVTMPLHEEHPVDMPPVAYMTQGYGNDLNGSVVPDKIAREARRAYYATVAEMDSRVGKVLDLLDELGLTNDTAVVFHGDHGWSLGEQNEWAKFTNFENSVRVPFLVRAPWVEGLAHGQRYKQLVELVDVLPTLADLAGVPLPTTSVYDGKSIVPVVEGKDIHEAAVSQFPRLFNSTTEHNRNIDHVPRENFTHMGYSIRTVEWRYTEWREWDGKALVAKWDSDLADVEQELYDHRDDPSFPADFDSYENFNLAAKPEYAKVVQELSAQLERLVRAGAAESVVV